MTIEITNRARLALMRSLDEDGIGFSSGSSITSTEPSSMISSASAEALTRDSSEATWEEMEMMIAKESNTTFGALLIMAIAGFVAAAGIATNALHVVIAAMVIAPDFEPLTRIALGFVAGSRAWKRGLSDALREYGALVAGAFIATWIIRFLGTDPLPGRESYLQPGSLPTYWTTTTGTSLAVSVAASIAGAILIASNRSVLTAGVMIALALIPSSTLIGMALVLQDWAVLEASAKRFIIEAGLVVVLSGLVLGWKRAFVHKRVSAL